MNWMYDLVSVKLLRKYNILGALTQIRTIEAMPDRNNGPLSAIVCQTRRERAVGLKPVRRLRKTDLCWMPWSLMVCKRKCHSSTAASVAKVKSTVVFNAWSVLVNCSDEGFGYMYNYLLERSQYLCWSKVIDTWWICYLGADPTCNESSLFGLSEVGKMVSSSFRSGTS